MTRINTNVSSLTAQKTLARSNAQLQESLTRLSTGLRINVGKDDPAGLIASEVLRSDIINVGRAITNSERANQLIGTADSALGQVGALLNDVRGLVSEAANTGALSQAQIDANQLQVDSSLDAIDRIAQITAFQGKRLLDGSMDFITSGVDTSAVQGLQINQANFGTQNSISVTAEVVTQATRGSLNFAQGAISDAVVLQVGGSNGTEAFNFAAGSTIQNMATAINLVSDATGVEAQVQQEAVAGAATVSSFGADNDIIITANTAGADEGDYRVKYDSSTAGATLAVSHTDQAGTTPGKISVTLGTTAWVAASGTYDQAGANNELVLTAKMAGTEFNGVNVVVANTAVAGSETFAYDHATKTLTIGVQTGVSTATQVIAALSAAGNAKAGALFTLANAAGSTGAGTLATQATTAVTAGGVNGGTITSTAADVAAAINANAGAHVTATLPTGATGAGAVTAFQEYARYGTEAANNALQFLGPENSRNVRFVSTPGQSLSVDLTTDPQVLGKSSKTVQGTNANSTFTVRAKTAGAAYDGAEVFLVDTGAGPAASVAWNAQTKRMTISANLAAVDATTVVNLINNDSYVNDFFEAENFGSSTGAGLLGVGMAGTQGTTSGGLISEGTAVVHLATNAAGVISTTANDLIAYFNDVANSALLSPLGISVTNVGASTGTGKLAATTTDLAFATSGTLMQNHAAAGTTNAVNGANARLTVTAVNQGAAYNGWTVQFTNIGANPPTFTTNSVTKTLTIGINGATTDANAIVTEWNNNPGGIKSLFTIAVGGTGAGIVTTSDTATLSGGYTDGGTKDGTALLGNSDATDTGLTLVSSTYGSDSFVSVKALSGTFAMTDSVTHVAADRSTGSDVAARINGIEAIGKGLSASINKATLDLTFTLASTVTGGSSYSFSITGGGAQFQLGPDVVSNQQARIGIQSVSTSTMGGVNGRLFELRSGGAKALNADIKGAAKVVDEVVTGVTQLRGRLGAFQKTTLETNLITLNDTLENLSGAESSIRDADFAAESAKLTRAQILVQSGVSVLAIANKNPESILALLR
ncbi:MAG: flagellin N-terminal helical domain-containing protein [Pirellulales bacterium]